MSYSKEVIKKNVIKKLFTEMWTELWEPTRDGEAPRNGQWRKGLPTHVADGQEKD